MLEGDLCSYCLGPGCAGDAATCPVRFDLAHLMVAQTSAEVRAADPHHVFTDGRGVLKICAFCGGAGGYHVPCHGCGIAGPAR